MIEFILEPIKTLNAVLSPERLKQQKRSSVAKSLAQLHLLINDIIEVGKQIVSADYNEDDLMFWVPINVIEAHHQRLSEVYILLKSSPLNEILQIHVPDYTDIHGLINIKSDGIRFLLSSVYGFVDNEKAKDEFNNLWKQKQLSTDPDLNENEILQFEGDFDADIVLGDAIEIAKEDAGSIGIHATPEHAQEALAILEHLRVANESLRKFISSEFKPEDLV